MKDQDGAYPYSRRKLNYFLVPVLLVCVDFLVVITTMWGSVYETEFFLGEKIYLPNAWRALIPILYMSNFVFADLYRTRRVMTDFARKMFRASTFALLTIIFFDFALQRGSALQLSRLFLLLFWINSAFLLYIERLLIRRIFSQLGIWKAPVVVVGAGDTAEKFVTAFGHNYDIMGFVEDDETKPLLERYPRLGAFSELEKVLKEYPTYEVVLAVPGLSKGKTIELFYRVQPFVKYVSFIPNLFGIPIGNLKTLKSLDDQLLMMRTRNNLNRISNRILKRIFDITVGTCIAICMMPIIAITYIAIKLDSDGPAFFNAERIGKDGKTFKCYKFRSMYRNSDQILHDYLGKHPETQAEWNEYQKLRGEDPRVTRVGKIIRKYSIDEFPQIFNVLEGTMSLVGPRPYLPRERGKIGNYLPVICMTTPGMTGLWQVSGRSNVSFDGRLKMDSWYVRNWSLWQDIVILFKTFGVFFSHDAY